MHGVSHWLGMDVHDAGSYRGEDKRGRILEPGMVLTVEPGIYVGENALENLTERLKLTRPPVSEEEIAEFLETVEPTAKKYRNIGVRIEDDVLITEDGHELFTSRAPTSIGDLEPIMEKGSFPSSRK